MRASEPQSAHQRLLASATEAVLGEMDWEGELGVTEMSALVCYRGEAGEWVVVASTFADQPVLVVYSLAPELVPPQRIGDVTTFVSLANNGLPLANLEIDVDRRLVKCRTSLDVEDVDVAALDRGGFLVPLVRRVILANVATLDMYLAALRAVIAGTMTPAEADAAIDDGEADER